MEGSNAGRLENLSWSFVLPWLPFEDQINCRLVCKSWLDIINSLSSFRQQNCLTLKYCKLSANQPPISVLQCSNLTFNQLRIGMHCEIQCVDDVIKFFAHLGEIVTVLDISGDAYSNVSRIAAENLALFAKLEHLIVYSPAEWMHNAFSSAPRAYTLRRIIAGMGFMEGKTDMNDEELRERFDRMGLKECRDDIEVQRHQELIFKTIAENWNRKESGHGRWVTDNLEEGHQQNEGNEEGRANVEGEPDAQGENVMSKAENMEAMIQQKFFEIDNQIDLSTRSNSNVKIVTMKSVEDPGKGKGFAPFTTFGERMDMDFTDHFCEKVLTLVPNVEQLQVHGSMHYAMQRVLKKYPSKVVGLTLYDRVARELLSTEFPNLRDVALYSMYDKQLMDQILEKNPTIQSLKIFCNMIPLEHFDLITKLSIYRLRSRVDLSELQLFKNLKSVSFNLWFRSPDQRASSRLVCFFVHEPIPTMAPIKNLTFSKALGPGCLTCFEALLQSLDLQKMTFIGDHDAGQFIEAIFRHQTRLKSLCIKSLEPWTIVEPVGGWPTMSRLRLLEILIEELHYTRSISDLVVFFDCMPKLRYVRMVEPNNPEEFPALPLLKQEFIKLGHLTVEWTTVVTLVQREYGLRFTDVYTDFFEDMKDYQPMSAQLQILQHLTRS